MTATGDRRTHARHNRACCLFTWGPRHGPQAPIARRAPAEPGRAAVTVVGDGGPEMAPKPPIARRAPAEPWRASIQMGAPTWPPTPIARRAPAEPGRASVTVVG